MATQNEKHIYVYADWQGLSSPQLLGILIAQRIRGKEIFSFEYDKSWLKSNYALFIDPDLGMFQGKQYLPESKQNFGIFMDSSPDRWGRLLMRRREAVLAKRENRYENLLFESDYLLGVYDEHRMGGLRFKLDPNGDYLNKKKAMASPPWTSLRELEQASLQLEREDVSKDPQYLYWLSLLIAPGSSLGGARPKASVIDEKGGLWIAKFPSLNDEIDSGAWEMTLNILAKQCGINVPEAKHIRFSGKHHTFLSKRFDRTTNGSRIHYASAMTLLGYYDGADHNEGVSYLELAGFIQKQSTSQDLEQLWRRIVFNVLVSNTDDHLRNHGFLLSSQGWVLSPAFDVNPNKFGTGLKLNITENSNELDLDLALEVAKYFQIKLEKAKAIKDEIISGVKNWRVTAKSNGINNNEIESLKNAFKVEMYLNKSQNIYIQNNFKLDEPNKSRGLSM